MNENARRASLRIILAAGLSLLVGPSLAGSSLWAQSPRMSVIEECTNASCPPCAGVAPYYRAFLEQYVAQDRLIPITYHASFPGRDVMYSANPQMNVYRVLSYYGVPGVPTAYVNGRVEVSPANPTQIGYGMHLAAGMSPITITVAEERAGPTDSITAVVTVSSIEPIANRTLHIVVIEGYHHYDDAGDNGEKEFVHIARRMLPDHMGTSVTLAPGGAKEVQQKFAIDPAWNADQVYVVAFLQNDSTREVLQAGTSRARFTLATTQQPTIDEHHGNAPATWAAGLSNARAGRYRVELAQALGAGWSGSITIDGRSVAEGDSITIPGGGAIPLAVTIRPGASDTGRGAVTLGLRGEHGALMRQTFRLYTTQQVRALLVTKDMYESITAEPWFTALHRGLDTVMVVPGDEVWGMALDSYRAVLVAAGTDPLDYRTADTLERYLDRGGRLLVAGSNVAWGLADTANLLTGYGNDTAFLHNYLHADYISDSSASSSVRGAAGDPVGAGAIFSLRSGIYYHDRADVIAPRDGAEAVYTYGFSGSAVAGIRYGSDRGRLVFLAFGPEMTIDGGSRQDLLVRALDWLSAGAPKSDVDPVAPGTARGMSVGRPVPNPALDECTVPVQLAHESGVAAWLCDAAGQRVVTLAERRLPAGMATLGLNTAALPAGWYRVVVAADGVLESRPLIVVR